MTQVENEIGFMKKESDPDGSFSFLLGGCCEACASSPWPWRLQSPHVGPLVRRHWGGME